MMYYIICDGETYATCFSEEYARDTAEFKNWCFGENKFYVVKEGE